MREGLAPFRACFVKIFLCKSSVNFIAEKKQCCLNPRLFVPAGEIFSRLMFFLTLCLLESFVKNAFLGHCWRHSG